MASRIHNSSISKNVRGNELLEGDIEHLKTVASLPNEASPWIDPGILNLTHRIGRGPFGDVWIGKLHQFTREYDECHDVAVKMLNFITENQMQPFMTKFEKLFCKCQGMQGICCPHGITVKNGKVCIVMKLYESCIGDKMAQLKGDRLPLKDVLRWHAVFARNMDIFSGREMLVDRTLSKNITRQWCLLVIFICARCCEMQLPDLPCTCWLYAVICSQKLFNGSGLVSAYQKSRREQV